MFKGSWFREIGGTPVTHYACNGILRYYIYNLGAFQMRIRFILWFHSIDLIRDGSLDPIIFKDSLTSDEDFVFENEW